MFLLSELPPITVEHVAPVSFYIERALDKLLEAHPELQREQVALISVKRVNWPNSSLGCPEEGVNYMQVITPGYELEFRVGEERFSVHTNLDGTQVAVPR
jgi:hypothetical protein